MNKDQIKKGLASKGYDFSMLAAAISKSPSLISKVASRKARSLPVAIALAKALDRSVEEVFPDVSAYHSNAEAATQRAQKQAELAAKLKQ